MKNTGRLQSLVSIHATNGAASKRLSLGTLEGAPGRTGGSGLRVVSWVLVAVAVVALADAVIRTPGDFDYRLLRILRADWFEPVARPLIAASGYSLGATFAAAMLWSLATRRWLFATVLSATLGFGLVLAGVVSVAMPGSPDLARISPNADGVDTWSGWWGWSVLWLLQLGVFAAAVSTAETRPARNGLQAMALVFAAVLVGALTWSAQLWAGALVAVLALSAVLVTGCRTAYRAMWPTTGHVPLVHANYVQPPAGTRVIHALTSTVLFKGDEVWKVYSPGFVPRLFYWLAFQAPFGYSSNERALVAAIERRNLAGLLTEFWFGRNAVAPALRLDHVDGRQAIVSRLVVGHDPSDHQAARHFLFDLTARFDEAGLPTWQIDPRQPRSLGNILESAPGEYTIIDLESGLVSPLASPKAWWRAVRRSQFPFYDDVTFDVTRAYIARNQAELSERMGTDWIGRLQASLDAADESAMEWHTSEPRIWSRLLRWTWSGFGIGPLRRRARSVAETSEMHAIAWMEQSIDRWKSEGRLDEAGADELRSTLESEDIAAVMPHFGVHLVIGMALRFPFGSIVRATYTSSQLLRAGVRFATRRTSAKEWRRSLGIHSPLVILIAAMPGIGTFAYLASWPVLSHRGLIRLGIDSVGDHLPWHIYQRSGFKRIVAPKAKTPSHAQALKSPSKGNTP